MPEFALDDEDLHRLIEAALLEDRAREDTTTRVLVPPDQQGRAVLLAKGEGVLAGLPVAEAVFATLDPSIKWQPLRQDSNRVIPGDRVALIHGPLAPILSAERAALNFLTHLSGVATATARVVATLQGTGCRLRDTRKTIPGLRSLEKYAVLCGGGVNHRQDLAAGVLVKDNHLAAARARGLSIPEAVRLTRSANPGFPIEVEVTTLEELLLALDAGADEVLLDNMNPEEIRQAVSLAAVRSPRPTLEASGGITLGNARQIAETGVDFISMGALTHSAPALDLSLEVEPA